MSNNLSRKKYTAIILAFFIGSSAIGVSSLVDNIVSVQYTYKCDCSYDKAEGYYSFVDNYWTRQCPNCNDYNEGGLE